MIAYIIRLIKRFAVLIPGLLITLIAIQDVFPNLEKRLPVGIAIFITYVLVAYVFIPAFIRLLRIIAPPTHPPTYCITPDGFASDPINIGLIGSRAQLIAAMHAAGWKVADKHNVFNTSRQIICTLLRRPYPEAPMSSLYLFGRKQDIGFEIAQPNSLGQRHHVRFWVTNYNPDQPPTVQTIPWRNSKLPISELRPLWLGAASKDIGFTLIRHNIQITHMIHPDTDDERDLIVGGLKKARQIGTVDMVRLGQPYRLINRAWRGYLESDGVMAVSTLTAS